MPRLSLCCWQLYEELGKDDCPFNVDERTELAEAIAAQERSYADAAETDAQQHEYVYNYLTESVWAYLFDKNNSLGNKLDKLAEFCQETIGLIRACSQTSRLITCIALSASQANLGPTAAKAKVPSAEIETQCHHQQNCHHLREQQA